MKRTDFEKGFRNPGSEYRSAPFWAWNDKLDTKEIKRQIYEMHNQGIGGFFIHSRDGLETEYLSDEWFECVKTAVQTAKELKMYAWLYDEDRWPSGSCGGAVTQNPDYACKGLTLEVCREVPNCEGDKILSIYLAEVNDDELISLRRLDSFENLAVEENEVILIARLEISEGSEWFNFSPPPDNLNPDTVREFITRTHEVYKRAVGDEFGKTVPGIFTDEPSLADRHCAFNPKRGWIPWTYNFTEYFRIECGYDALDEIPYLYFNHEKSRKIRHDYWKTVSKRFKEAYSEQISRWCGENNLKFTGHFLQEDKLGLSCRVNGSIMPHYISQDVPAIDMLTEKCEEYMTVKQCSSVASQMGKEVVLSETYGCTGWDFSFEGQKWVGDWQYVLGVNMRCQHLALYSLRGCRKRDYPPSINCNTSWWKHYKTVEDYFSRCAFMLRQGKAVRKVLLIHPTGTVWSVVGCDPYGNPKRNKERDVPKGNEIGERFNTLIKNMCKKHYDCDLGDENIICDYSKCENSEFAVGKCSYNTVIVPFCENLLSSTAEKLIEFMNGGGTVLGVSPFTVFINGEKSDITEKLVSHRNFMKLGSEEELFDYMQNNIRRMVSITDEKGGEDEGVLYQLRHDSDGYILFVVNNDRKNTHTVNISLEIEDAVVYRADLSSGETVRVKTKGTNGRLCFEDCLSGCASSMFYITATSNIICDEYEKKPSISDTEIGLMLTGCEIDKPNVLTLDRCRYRLDGEAFDEEEVWKAQYKIRDRLEMRQIHLNGIEQRYRWTKKPHANDGHIVVLEFEFTTKIDVSNAKLVLERPECFEISLDGEKIGNSDCGYFFDREFKLIKLPRIDKGKHIISLKCCYKNNMELENCYIIGDFGVNERREICERKKEISLGDITKQGYLHYAGDMDYIFECDVSDLKEELYLDIRKFKGICAAVKINGTEIPVSWRAGSVINVTDYLNKGKNQIIVTVSVSLRNMLGPLHITNKPVVTKDSCFASMGDNYTSDYITSDVGLYDLKLFKGGLKK